MEHPTIQQVVNIDLAAPNEEISEERKRRAMRVQMIVGLGFRVLWFERPKRTAMSAERHAKAHAITTGTALNVLFPPP